MDPRYLDVASRWPLRPEAATAWNDAVALDLGDPTRHHRPGRRAAELLDRATATVATTFGVKPERIVWTSGGTEAVHLAVAGTVAAADHAGDHRSQIVVSAVEHSSVLEAAQRVAAASSRTVTTIGVDHAGRIDVDAARAAISSDTLAVHVQHANHEVGTLQPVHEIARIAHDAGALVHVDACQTAGQVGFTLAQLDADLISASAAKFGGCAGVGVLALGDRARILPQFVGDDRQHHRRAGMLDTAALAASAVALRVATDRLQQEHSTRETLRRRLREALVARVPDVAVHGPLADAHPGIVAFSALYVDGATLQIELDRAGFAVHSGSSCASAAGAPSHVLVAMKALTHGHVRVSFGPETGVADIDAFVRAYAAIVERLRARHR